MFFVLIFGLLAVVLAFAGFWKTFAKAGQPGWTALIPFLNVLVILRISGRPLWWILLFLIPFVNIVISFVVFIDVARNFGKTALFGVGMALIPWLFFLILGFDDSRYQGEVDPIF